MKFRKPYVAIVVAAIVSNTYLVNGEEEIKAPGPLAPPPAKQVSIQERADKLPLLKYVPTDSSFVLGVYHWPDIKVGCGESHICQTFLKDEENSSDASAEMAVDPADIFVKNIVFAGNSDWPTMVRNMIPLIKRMGRTDLIRIETSEQSVVSEVDEIDPNEVALGLLEASAWNSQAKTPFLLAAVEMEPTALSQVAQQISLVAKMSVAMGKTPYLENVSQQVNGIQFEGIRINGSKLDPSAFSKNLSPEVIERLKTELAKRNLYVMWGCDVKANVGIIAICTNPQTQLSLPVSVEQSIVSRPEFAFADARLDAHSLMIGWINSDLVQESIEYNKSVIEIEGDIDIKASQKAVEEKKITQEQATQYAQTVQNLNHVKKQLIDMYDTSQPISFYSWQEGQKIFGEIISGSYRGYDWNHSASSLSGLLTIPDTLGTAIGSTTPEHQNMTLKYWGYAREKAEIDEMIDSESSGLGLSEIKGQLADIWLKSHTSLHPTCGLVADMKGEAPNGFLGLPSGVEQQIRIPRVAMIAGVHDIASVQASWKETQNLLFQNLKSMGLMAKDTDISQSDQVAKEGFSLNVMPVLGPGKDWSPASIEQAPYMLMSSSSPFLTEVYGLVRQPNMANVIPTVYGPLGVALKIHMAPYGEFVESLNQIIESLKVVDKAEMAEMETIGKIMKVFSRDIQSVSITISQENGKMATRYMVEKTPRK